MVTCFVKILQSRSQLWSHTSSAFSSPSVLTKDDLLTNAKVDPPKEKCWVIQPIKQLCLRWFWHVEISNFLAEWNISKSAKHIWKLKFKKVSGGKIRDQKPPWPPNLSSESSVSVEILICVPFCGSPLGWHRNQSFRSLSICETYVVLRKGC